MKVGPMATFVLSTGCAKWRLAVEVPPSCVDKYISRLLELEPWSKVKDPHFVLYICVTLNSERQSKKRKVSLQGTETEVFCLISTSTPPPAFDPEDNPREMAK